MKTKNFKKIIFLLGVVAILSSCKAKEDKNISSSNTKEVSSSAKADSSVDEKNKKEKTMASESNAQEKTNKKSQENKDYELQDGEYVATFAADKKGEVDEYIGANIYSAIASESELTVKGSLTYRKSLEDIDNSVDMENKTYFFKTDANTSYQAVSGQADPQNFTIEEFNNYAKEVENSGLALIIAVVDGKVQSVKISS